MIEFGASVLGLVIFLTTFYFYILWARILTHRPFWGVLPVGIALFVCAQSFVLQVLSLSRSVYATHMVLSHIALFTIVFGYYKFIRKKNFFYLPKVKKTSSLSISAIIFPLAVLLLLVGLFYPTNNGDSMTYHMPRVAMWYQNHSVEFYPLSTKEGPSGYSAILFHNIAPPGAEYLILFLQLLTKNDLFANFVQWLAFFSIFISLHYLLRNFGLNKHWSRWGAVFFATLPMGVLQATSTQNDLMAASTTISILICSIPFFQSKTRAPRIADYFLLIISIGAALLVKPTAGTAAIPILLIALVCFILGFQNLLAKKSTVFYGATIAAIAFLLTAFGQVWRTHKMMGTFYRGEIFPLFGEWKERVFNIAKSTWYHNFSTVCDAHPIEKVRRFLHLPERAYFDCTHFSRHHEDLQGNPYHFYFMISATLIWLWLYRSKKLDGRTKLFGLIPFLSLASFQMFVRDQANISRLQSPVFATFSLLLLAAILFANQFSKYKKVLLISLQIFILSSVVYAYKTAFLNETRPISSSMFNIDREKNYYIHDQANYALDTAALQIASAIGCTQLGHENDFASYEYPIFWRGCQQGIRTRYIGDDRYNYEWPCVLLHRKKNGFPLWTPPPNSSWIFTQFTDVFVKQTQYEVTSNTATIEKRSPHNWTVKHVYTGDLIKVHFENQSYPLNHVVICIDKNECEVSFTTPESAKNIQFEALKHTPITSPQLNHCLFENDSTLNGYSSYFLHSNLQKQVTEEVK